MLFRSKGSIPPPTVRFPPTQGERRLTSQSIDDAPISVAILLITLRVMRFHHAERDEDNPRSMRTFALTLLIALLTSGCHSGDRSVAELEAMLGSDDPNVRIKAANGLSRHGPAAKPALPALTRALQSPETLLREQAALAIGAMGPEARDAAPSLGSLLGDSHWNVRRQAALALGRIGASAKEYSPMLQRLERDDPHSLVRKAAKESIGTLK